MYNYESQIQTKKNEILIPDQLQTLINDWIDTHANSSVLSIAKNKLDDILVAINSKDTIYLFGGNYQSLMYAPKLTFSMRSNYHLHIDDINSRHNNVGNGSILLMALINYARMHNISTITGDLSSIDSDHRDRLEHYYAKFGFKILPNAIRLEVS